MCQFFLNLFIKRSVFFCASVIVLTACNTSPQIPYKGQDLDSLDQAANYISSKGVARKLLPSGLVFDEKAFVLGAYDQRDALAARVPETDYDKLMIAIQQKRPNFSSFTKNDSNKSINSLDVSNEDSQYPEGLNSAEKRMSYLTARNIALMFSKQGIPIHPASMLLGVKDAPLQVVPKLNELEEKVLLKAIKEKLLENANDWVTNKKIYYQNEEKKFFAHNITQPEINMLDSGVQYKIIEQGKGAKPTTKDKIKIHYRGTLLDGTEFDSSYTRNNPATFPLKAMIAGFIQAMQQIPEGSTATIYIPSALAYKERGTVGVPPNAAIVFDIEFLQLNP